MLRVLLRRAMRPQIGISTAGQPMRSERRGDDRPHPQTASALRPSGQWSDYDYDVLENGQSSDLRRANGHIRRAAHGYAATREAAMAAFAKSWRRE